MFGEGIQLPHLFSLMLVGKVASRMWISSAAFGSQESLPDHVAYGTVVAAYCSHRFLRLGKLRLCEFFWELKALPRDTEVNSVAQGRHGTARWISISRGKELPRRASCTKMTSFKTNLPSFSRGLPASHTARRDGRAHSAGIALKLRPKTTVER